MYGGKRRKVKEIQTDSKRVIRIQRKKGRKMKKRKNKYLKTVF
jgi:hypothetical protein